MIKLLKSKLIILLPFLFTAATHVYAVEPLPSALINFTAPSQLNALKKDLNPNLVALLSNFSIQKNQAYCGVASAAMILNSTAVAAPVDPKYSPYHYFTQDNFFNEKVDKIITAEETAKEGMTLTQLAQAIQTYGVTAHPFFVDDQFTLEKFRTTLTDAISKQQFIIVNFLRSALKEKGYGHHAPIAAYDKATDRFLLLDVARYKYPFSWVKAEDLWKATHTLDGKTYRGFIIINPNKN